MTCDACQPELERVHKGYAAALARVARERDAAMGAYGKPPLIPDPIDDLPEGEALRTDFATPGTPFNYSYELRQRLHKAMRWLREAEDFCRQQAGPDAHPESYVEVAARRIRVIHEKLTSDVLQGKITVPTAEER